VTQQRGMLWGTYRTAFQVVRMIASRTHTRGKRSRRFGIGGVLRLAIELLPNDSLTWQDLSTIVDVPARWWLPHDDRSDAKRCGPTENEPAPHRGHSSGIPPFSAITFQLRPWVQGVKISPTLNDFVKQWIFMIGVSMTKRLRNLQRSIGSTQHSYRHIRGERWLGGQR
jgi:hypothetical protein